MYITIFQKIKFRKSVPLPRTIQRPCRATPGSLAKAMEAILQQPPLTPQIQPVSKNHASKASLFRRPVSGAYHPQPDLKRTNVCLFTNDAWPPWPEFPEEQIPHRQETWHILVVRRRHRERGTASCRIFSGCREIAASPAGRRVPKRSP